MSIYVMSRGHDFNEGYEWHEISSGNEHKAEPIIVKELDDLIEAERFSLVLGRFQQQLALYMTGLDAVSQGDTTGRADQATRRIRNAVLWARQCDPRE